MWNIELKPLVIGVLVGCLFLWLGVWRTRTRGIQRMEAKRDIAGMVTKSDTGETITLSKRMVEIPIDKKLVAGNAVTSKAQAHDPLGQDSWETHPPQYLAKIAELELELAAARRERDRALVDKSFAYYERNILVMMLIRTVKDAGLVAPTRMAWLKRSKDLFYVGRRDTPEFRNWSACVYIEPPMKYGLGQISWHFHDDHAWMFAGLKLPEYTTPWDKRDKYAKYEGIRKWFTKSVEPQKL